MKTKTKKKHYLRMPLWLCVPALVLSAVLIAVLTVYIQPDLFRNSIKAMLETPSLLALNFFPVLALILVLYCLTGSVFGSAAATSLVMTGLSYANLLKLEGRNDPLIPSDVMLLRESLTAAGDYQLDMHPFLLFLMIGAFLGFTLLAIFLRSRRPRWFWRLGWGALLTAAFAVSMLTIYPDKDYYNALPGVYKANVPLVYNTYGFPYCFLHNLDLYPIDRPEGYDQARVDGWKGQTLEQETPVEANILFVMGEAFTDLAGEPVFSYGPGESPLTAYYAVAESPQAISGDLVCSNVSAGTANTEYDVLTGMMTNYISEHTTSSFRAVHRNVESLARVYGGAGYDRWFMHPGHDWFYNRCNVYRYFGMEDQTFEEAFTQEDYTGSYISDEAFLRVLEENWSALTGAQDRTFAYTVTIENHQSYGYSKYSYAVEEPLPVTVDISEEVREQLSVYFHGVRNTSEMLLSLTEYLDASPEPTLLVFFGDHRPNLGADFMSYRAIGSQVGLTDSPEAILYTYETPYVIWANDALMEKMDFAAAAEALELPPEGKISANYLGSLVYELTGMKGTSPYWDYLTEARRVLPVVGQEAWYLPDGSYATTLTEEQNAVLERLIWWQYDRLKHGLDN